MRSYAGLRVDREHVYLDPHLPKTWRELRFNLHFRGDRYEFVIHPSKLDIRVGSPTKDAIELGVQDRKIIVRNQRWESVELT